MDSLDNQDDGIRAAGLFLDLSSYGSGGDPSRMSIMSIQQTNEDCTAIHLSAV